MSVVKAQHIRDYLTQFPAPAASSDSETTGKRKAKAAVPAFSIPDAEATFPVVAAQTLNLLLQQVLRASEVRPRLNRALSEIGERIAALVSDPTLSATSQQRAVRRLRRLAEECALRRAPDDLDKKAQARLADILTEAAERLAN